MPKQCDLTLLQGVECTYLVPNNVVNSFLLLHKSKGQTV